MSDNVRKITMNLTNANVDFVEKLSEKINQTRTTIVNHAIDLERIFRTEVENGSKILIEDKNGNTKEVIIR
jgi:hypothetical protein